MTYLDTEIYLHINSILHIYLSFPLKTFTEFSDSRENSKVVLLPAMHQISQVRDLGDGVARCHSIVMSFKTFFSLFQEKAFLKVINLEYGHRCRAEPVEAAVYSLEAKGEELDKFRANASAELTVELEETTDEEEERKLEYSSMELPVDFTKEYLAKV